MNGAPLNSTALNSSGALIDSFKDLQGFLPVGTNPALATFKEIPASISVAVVAPDTDQNASITVSSYKWLTTTLQAAQNGPGYTPYYTCKVVNDTITPNAILTAPNVPLNGDSVVAPDGTTLSVGADASGNLGFWKLTDPSGSWATYTTLVVNGSWINTLNSSVAVSNWIGGTYVVDVYYYVANGANYSIAHQRSSDGGATWSSAITVNTVSLVPAKPIFGSNSLITSNTGISTSFTVGTDNYRVLIATLSTSTAGPSSPGAVYAGVEMTLANQFVNGTVTYYQYYLNNPASGSNTFTWNVPSGVNGGVLSYYHNCLINGFGDFSGNYQTGNVTLSQATTIPATTVINGQTTVLTTAFSYSSAGFPVQSSPTNMGSNQTLNYQLTLGEPPYTVLSIGDSGAQTSNITSSIASSGTSIQSAIFTVRLNAPLVNNYLSAGTPVLLGNNVVSGMVFYNQITLETNWLYPYGRIAYQYYTGGTSFSPETIWSTQVDSQDWTLHSLHSIYKEGSYYIVFSGFHNYLDTVPNFNYGIYAVQLKLVTSNQATDNWSLTTDVLTSVSNTSTNFNTFTYPKVSYDGKTYFILFKAVVVDGVTQGTTGTAGNVITNTYYYMSQSLDMQNFTYPSPLASSTGVVFSSDKGYCFVFVPTTGVPNITGYYYTIGNGVLWQYIKNNIIADITNSVLDYQITEQSGAANSISIDVGNGNNQWIPGGTNTGAAALGKNMKIYLEQGYFNANGVGETVPRNIFYIDDITQTVNANNNQFNIAARDSNKMLQNLATRFSLNYRGLNAYSDIYNGTTLGNWNIVSGSWQEVDNALFAQFNGTQSGGLPTALIALNNAQNNTDASVLFTTITVPDVNSDPEGAYCGVCPVYIDENNFIAYYILNLAGTLVDEFIVVIDGVVTGYGDLPLPQQSLISGQQMPVMINKFGFNKYSIILGNPYTPVYTLGNNLGYDIGTFDPTAYSSHFSSYPWMDNGNGHFFDAGQVFTEGQSVMNGGPALFTYAMGGVFQYFKYVEFNRDQSIQDVIKRLGVLSGMTLFNTQYNFSDNQFLTPSNYNGTYTLSGGNMVIAPSQYVINNSAPLMNGELDVTATVIPTSSASNYSLNIIFGGSTASGISSGNRYRFNIVYNVSGAVTTANFYLDNGATSYLICPSSPYLYQTYTGGQVSEPNVVVDITKSHNYRLVYVNQYMYMFIDDRLILAWIDNNPTLTGATFSNGYWGFQTDSNSSLKVSNINQRQMWTQVESLSVNPGDDITTTLANVVETTKGWTYTDLMGRLNGIVLSPTSPSTFTYNGQLYVQSYDNSDKEYVNQVTVYGVNGITAIAQNTASIGMTGRTRAMIINDNTITTYTDALARAQYELNNANTFNTQNNPQNPNNVGGEIFDVVTIVNTGSNSTGVSGTFRVYNQTINNNGSKGTYDIEPQTGALS